MELLFWHIFRNTACLSARGILDKASPLTHCLANNLLKNLLKCFYCYSCALCTLIYLNFIQTADKC